MSLAPTLVGVAAAAFAAACAAGDGAVLALDGESEPPSDAAALLSARELTHRALVVARLCAHLVAGAAFAVALGLDERIAAGPLALLVVLVLGVALLAEVVARLMGEAAGGRLLGALSPVLVATSTAVRPAVAVLQRMDAALLRRLPAARSAEELRVETTEQFRRVVAAEPQVSAEARSLLDGVFSLGETEVREVMVPRVDLVAIEAGAPWSEVLDRVRSAGHSRYPVYEESVDEVRGILYAKDLLPAVSAGREPEGGWESLVRPAAFIPTTKRLDHLLTEFQTTNSHLAIVVDEFGGVAGLVTIEDILEQIVGEIRDERDEEEEADVVARDGRRFWVSGRVTLDELSEVTEHSFEAEDVTTVGGLIYATLGRVPRAGEALTLHGFRVVVEKVVGRRIRRVYFERLESLAGRQAD
jgi:putative hemolysin